MRGELAQHFDEADDGVALHRKADRGAGRGHRGPAERVDDGVGLALAAARAPRRRRGESPEGSPAETKMPGDRRAFMPTRANGGAMRSRRRHAKRERERGAPFRAGRPRCRARRARRGRSSASSSASASASGASSTIRSTTSASSVPVPGVHSGRRRMNSPPPAGEVEREIAGGLEHPEPAHPLPRDARRR